MPDKTHTETLKKTCKKCQNTFTLDRFHKDSEKALGVKNTCKDCSSRKKSKSKTLYEVFGTELEKTVEKEQKFLDQRLDRRQKIGSARDLLFLEGFEKIAARFKDKIEPRGYAKVRNETPRNTNVLFLSDLHIGSNLSPKDNPIPFQKTEEQRRLASILHRTLDKADSRTELVLLLGGDLIEGSLGHDDRDALPLAEQQFLFWSYLSRFIGSLAEHYPAIRIYCQVGNHGRNKLRHIGRATSSKWDSFEFAMYQALELMCSGLNNVKFKIDFRALSIIEMQGKKLLMSHGDTEIKLGDPDTCYKTNQYNLLMVQRDLHFDGACFGHYHKPRFQGSIIPVLFNGALVPPNGYARSEGYITEQSGQFFWQPTRENLFSGLEFFGVDKSTDQDSSLDGFIF